jgi:hypothetical protein
MCEGKINVPIQPDTWYLVGDAITIPEVAPVFLLGLVMRGVQQMCVQIDKEEEAHPRHLGAEAGSVEQNQVSGKQSRIKKAGEAEYLIHVSCRTWVLQSLADPTSHEIFET